MFGIFKKKSNAEKAIGQIRKELRKAEKAPDSNMKFIIIEMFLFGMYKKYNLDNIEIMWILLALREQDSFQSNFTDIDEIRTIRSNYDLEKLQVLNPVEAFINAIEKTRGNAYDEVVIKWKNKILRESLNYNDETPFDNGYEWKDLQIIDYENYDSTNQMYEEADIETKKILEPIISSIGKPKNRICVHFDLEYDYYSSYEVDDFHQEAGWSGILYLYSFSNDKEELEFTTLLNSGIFNEYLHKV